MHIGSVLIVICSLIMYHISQKNIPAGANPFFILMAIYAIALAVSATLFFTTPRSEGIADAAAHTNWAVLLLALSIVGLEIGYLLAYRYGWNVSTAALLSNTSATMLLIPIGLIFFKETHSLVNYAGIALCIAGIVMMNLDK